MAGPNCTGLMAVIVVSSSVALVAVQLHKRLVSDFMGKIASELGGERRRRRKKVRFAADVVEPSSDNKEYRRRRRGASGDRAVGDIALSLQIVN